MQICFFRQRFRVPAEKGSVKWPREDVHQAFECRPVWCASVGHEDVCQKSCAKWWWNRNEMAYIITSPIQYNTIHTAILIYIAMVNRSSISGCHMFRGNCPASRLLL